MDPIVWKLIFVPLLVVVASICKSVQDTLQFHFHTSIFSHVKNQRFWNPDISWTNKWKEGKRSNGEKFFLSSTLLVGVTDAWHLFGTIRNLSWVIAVSIAAWNPLFLFSYLIFIAVFHALFTWIFYRKDI